MVIDSKEILLEKKNTVKDIYFLIKHFPVLFLSSRDKHRLNTFSQQRICLA